MGACWREMKNLAERFVRTGLLLAACGWLTLFTSCATSIDGERETMGEALKRMDKSLDNTLNRLQRKTYPIY